MRAHTFLFVGSLIGCVGSVSGTSAGGGGGGGGGGDDTGGGDDQPPAVDDPTYYRDVLPILQEKCNHCHAVGAPGFPLDSYAAAAGASESIAAATAARVMPPWPPDPACGSFEGEDRRLLASGEIGTLGNWHQAGAPEGDPADAPGPPTPIPTLGDPDLTLDPGGDYMFDPSHEDLYWCFRLPGDFGAGMDVIGMELVPGNKTLVHHVIVFREPGGAAKAKGLPGFQCDGVPPATDFFFGWAPGAGPATFPPGVGMHLDGGDALVMQIHYHRNTTVSPIDRTRLLLYRAGGALTKTLRVVWTGSIDINVPPGGEQTATGDCAIPPGAGPVELYAVAPHMHQTATQFRSVVSRGGSEECLIDIPRWDFEWQGGYRYRDPLVLHPGDVIQTRCTYKNDGAQPVAFGEGSADEMCFQFNFVYDDGTLPEKCFPPCNYLPCDLF